MQSAKPQGSRLRPVADPLERVGFVSKGDKTLLNHKAQQDYYDTIVERYFRFCSDHHNDFDAAHASLPISSSNDATSNPPAAQSAPKTSPLGRGIPPPSAELSKLLLSLRKLREGILATSGTTPPEFAQRVHYFSIRLAILAQHPPSYFPSLEHCLNKLHSRSHPMPDSEVKDIVTYLILDYACRQENMVSAFELRARARRECAFQSLAVDRVLTALMHDNWVIFWQVHKTVDSYTRAVMNWAVDRVRRHALKAVGSAYLNAPVDWIVGGCTGDDVNWTWEKLHQKENLGWQKEGDIIIIRRLKPRPPPNPQVAKA
ncbi:SAC3/GANP/Nin1/mts3/eIF-3 p25 [Penicillium angulare]|uniref:SAC3/GANP/Nin1/mts3/eIF-3 p25 n=1 Tax=Penicillium angulare TaxID=116970 RepID=UPI00253F764B|nr:SAC3/GANP/Nin1/mts3/eIF-3 p25 [Penicillium angulare]KAJ5287565.1 SAC3/GANP/Nin1/mts3/eIF-3 p25 [Penicillium angulare]